MRGRIPEIVIAVGAIAVGVLLAAVIIGQPQGPAPPDGLDPRSLAWKNAPAVIEGGGLFGVDQLAPLPDRIMATRVIWNEAAQVQEGRLVSSVDGRAWELAEGPIEDVPIDAVATIDGAAWAFGPLTELETEQEIWRSTDGLDWDRIEDVTGLPVGEGRIASVVGSGRTMVAQAWKRIDAESSEGLLLRSDDGREWVPVRQPRGPSYGLRGLGGSTTGFTVLFATEDARGGQIGEAWQSIDGRRWTQHPVAGPVPVFNFFDVASGPAGQVAVGLLVNPRADYQPAAWFSRDGQFWRAAPVDLGPDQTFGAMREVVAFGSGFVSFGGAGSGVETEEVAWVSLDGIRWAALGSWPVGSEREDVEGAVLWKERLIATGQSSDDDGRGLPVVWIGEVAP